MEKRQAVMVILMRAGKVLLGRRSASKKKAPGFWCPISGHIEDRESEESAVIREAKEEIGVDVIPLRRCFSSPTDDGEVVLHWWLAEIAHGEPRISNEENSELGWFTEAELRGLRPAFAEDLEILIGILRDEL